MITRRDLLKRLILGVGLTGVAAAVTACGRKGALDGPEGRTYPRQYPAPPQENKPSS